VARYDRQPGRIDHLMSVEPVLGHYALIASTTGTGGPTFGAVTLVDLDALAPEGSSDYVDRLEGVDAAYTVTSPANDVFVTVRRGNLAVLDLDARSLHLTRIGGYEEPGVFYGKATLVGDRLYVPAHAYGLRIFDVSTPARPRLVGSLTSGLDDAFAVAVSGTTAYVADGAGGLKVVDVSDVRAPRVVGGENPTTATGTAEDVLVHEGDVFVAEGGAGVAVYDGGLPWRRTLYDTPVAAEHLAVVGDDLAVADIGGLQVFAFGAGGSLTPVVSESGMYREDADDPVHELRLWHGVAAYGTDGVLAADWSSMDRYRLVPGGSGQPDITADRQRLRFPPQGGAQTVHVTNQGSVTLQAQRIASDTPTFTVSPTQATVPPGGSVDLTIRYRGGEPGQGRITIESNDPDEDPLPIEVFGATRYVDPGERAPGFSLQSWTYDHVRKTFSYGTFDLASQRGKVIYFQVFASW
jgi:hypothetical protein